MRKAFKLGLQFMLVTAMIAGGFAVVLNRQAITDWWYLRDYTPPAQIRALSEGATLTPIAQRYFYRSAPELNSQRANLVQNCRIQNDQTIELGCYLSSNKIYLLKIDQPELANQMIVTAAHETLHASYDRLSSSERQRVDGLVQTEASKGAQAAAITARIKDYGDISPQDKLNELHSIIGTEFNEISPALKLYYSQYFINRSQVVDYSEEFNRTFDGLRDQITQLDARITSTRSRMNSLLAAGQVRAYNNLVPGINADITLYNSKDDLYNRYAAVLLGKQGAVK